MHGIIVYLSRENDRNKGVINKMQKASLIQNAWTQGQT